MLINLLNLEMPDQNELSKALNDAKQREDTHKTTQEEQRKTIKSLTQELREQREYIERMEKETQDLNATYAQQTQVLEDLRETVKLTATEKDHLIADLQHQLLKLPDQ